MMDKPKMIEVDASLPPEGVTHQWGKRHVTLGAFENGGLREKRRFGKRIGMMSVLLYAQGPC